MQYYYNAEMSKLTDSEGEYWPADDESRVDTSKAPKSKADEARNASTAPASTNMDRLNDFLENDFDDDGSGFFFSDEDDAKVIKSKNLKV